MRRGNRISDRRRVTPAVRAVALAVLCAALWAPAARADTATCNYTAGNHTATVAVTSGTGPASSIAIRSSDGALLVGGAGVCGAATRANTDTIVVNSTNAAPNGSLFYIYPFTPFTPGFTNEPGNSDEIEMVFNLTGGGRWILGISAANTSIPLDIALGGTSLNLNAGEADGVDADATIAGPNYAFVMGSLLADRILAGGGPGVAGPFDLPIVTSSGPGADVLSGGRLADDLSGGLDPDVIQGGAGKDDLKGEAGIDKLFGQAGADELLGGPAKDLVNGGKGRDRCTTKQDKAKGCELFAADKK